MPGPRRGSIVSRSSERASNDRSWLKKKKGMSPPPAPLVALFFLFSPLPISLTHGRSLFLYSPSSEKPSHSPHTYHTIHTPRNHGTCSSLPAPGGGEKNNQPTH